MAYNVTTRVSNLISSDEARVVIICHLLTYNAVGLSGAGPRPPVLLNAPFGGGILFIFNLACAIIQVFNKLV